jgi:predicted esterase
MCYRKKPVDLKARQLKRPDNLVYFAHGKESGPWGAKITRLAEIAKGKGFAVESPDYSFTVDPQKRVQKLLELNPQATQHLILVGSSMGAYVCAAASAVLKPHGLFLLAPAFYIPHYPEQKPKPAADLVYIIHGYDDELIPVDHSIRFAREYKARLFLLEGDHRLTEALPQIEKIFGLFLDEVLVSK